MIPLLRSSHRPGRRLVGAGLVTLALGASAPARAFFVDGDGHYALRGETQTAPAFSKGLGTYQAIQQSFRLKGEARFNDQSSMFLEFRLFDNARESYLGDTAQPQDCPQAQTGDAPDNPANPCEGEYQNTGEPGYKPYVPRVTKAYIRYAFDYCILEAGRRGRNWGLGIFLDAGDDPFETGGSVFDGVTCNVNIQKTQTLGFSIGYDKLAETGALIDESRSGRRFGANDTNDDIDQFYFTIEFDDRKANAGAAFTKQIGVYFAQINSRAYGVEEDAGEPDENGTLRGKETGGSNTDLKFLDLYTGFYFSDLAIKNEILFRMGKSKDPNFIALGGLDTEDGEPATNKLDSIAFAGGFEWTISRSGSALGPAEYNKGDASRHVAFINYAYAPGDKQGYFSGHPGAGDGHPGQTEADEIGTGNRDSKVTAIELNRNFKPALLLFNARPEADSLIEDGVFHPSRMVNATLFATGYKYESVQTGNFEVKAITARLNNSIPGKLKDYYDAREDDETIEDDGSRPAGFYGRELGYELDLSYGYKVGREAELGIAAAAALPGEAWKTSVDDEPANNFLVQSWVNFAF